MPRRFFAPLLVVLTLASVASGEAPFAERLSAVRSQADLDALIAATGDAGLAKALQENASAILAAAAGREHTAAVARTVELAEGKVERRNATPESLKTAAGGELPLFDLLTLVDLAVPGTGPHDKRKVDPYDRAFFEHLGKVTSLESLNVIGTKLDDEQITLLAELTNLKSLRFTNNGKLSDAGLAALANMKQLEAFNFVGTKMQGHAFAGFDGWTKLTRSSFRGSAIDDEGLKNICERFANLESISLAHAHFTDAGAVHLAKLTKLKGLELGSREATTACLANLAGLPLEYLQLGDGLDAPAGFAAVRAIGSLRRLTLTNSKTLDDAGLKQVAEIKQLELLELGGLPLDEARIAQLKAFGFLKTLVLVNRPAGYPQDLREKIIALMPNVEVKFVQ
jgi:hypothetical protein